MLEHLKKLAAHLESLDSKSKDAKAIRWAISEIEGHEQALIDARADGREAGQRIAEEN